MYDYDRLRKDLKDYFLSAYHRRGYDKAIDELIAVEFASNEEIFQIAKVYGYDLEDYEQIENNTTKGR